MNQNFADELVRMMEEDQRLLQQLFNSGELPSESYHPRMKALHEKPTLEQAPLKKQTINEVF